MERRTKSRRMVEPQVSESWDTFLDNYLTTSTRPAVDQFLAGLACLGRPAA